ncbi:hypothetical protein N9I66_07390 [Pseudomonadales bacterium]|nr:hypothetical protein [Pseudomonadales bacterium]
MPLRILIIASTLIFIAGCESELDKCITANLAKVEMNTIDAYDGNFSEFTRDQRREIFNSQEYIQFEKILDSPDTKLTPKEFNEKEYNAMRAGLKSIQEKEARLARISAENFCNLQGIY